VQLASTNESHDPSRPRARAPIGVGMTTPCPCGCGRQLPVDCGQLFVIAHDEASPLDDLALVNGLPIWAVRHIRHASDNRFSMASSR
jgi:hypothetical protein